MDNHEQEILDLFKDGDCALMSVQVLELQRIYADDYVQCNEAGARSTRADLIRNLTLRKIRFLSMNSTGRWVRVFGECAVVHGSEVDEIERDGETFSITYIYTDVVIRRDGRWQIVASQLAKP